MQVAVSKEMRCVVRGVDINYSPIIWYAVATALRRRAATTQRPDRAGRLQRKQFINVTRVAVKSHLLLALVQAAQTDDEAAKRFCE